MPEPDSLRPLISVVMPVYNGMATLERAVRTVREQIFADWELLVIDDGSTDGSREAVERWAAEDGRIRPLRTAEPSGPSAARNVGLRAARGELICYLDCDDEYYPDYLAQVARLRDKGEVLVFGYDMIQDADGAAAEATEWRPELVRSEMFAVNIVTPLGVAHRRGLVEKVGGFNETLWAEEDWDLWRRSARAGAEFVFLPLKSGRYHVHPDSRSRAPRLTPKQRQTAVSNWQAGRPIHVDGVSRAPQRLVRQVAFASPYCLVDPTSGAATATVQMLQLLHRLGFTCQAFCGSQIDAPEEGLIEQTLAAEGSPYEARRVQINRYDGRMIFAMQGPVPLTIFQAVSTQGWWRDPGEVEAFLTAFGQFLAKNRPDVLLTYGGDPVSHAMLRLAKSRDIPIVFCLHNFGYADPGCFSVVDYVTVPSEFSRQYHWQSLGLASQALPNVIDRGRVLVAARRPEYVTFVNPDPCKGVYVFARIAEGLARRRQDIPILVVEGRGQRGTLRQTGIDLSAVTSLQTMPNTPDPREFYGVTKLVIMPSLWNESFGLVAAEAMLNGIPVLASNRGALPEIVGEAGFLFDIPACYTPDSRSVPTAEDVEPWVEAIIRLWDDANLYRERSCAAEARARRWLPEQLGPRYRDFFGEIYPQPGPPLVPRATDA